MSIEEEKAGLPETIYLTRNPKLIEKRLQIGDGYAVQEKSGDVPKPNSTPIREHK